MGKAGHGARLRAPRLILALLIGATSVTAASAQQSDVIVLPSVNVIGVTPLPGTGLERERAPSNIQALTEDDVEAAQASSFNDLLNRRVGSVTVSDTQNNPLQPELNYRGFTASPLLGLPQGIAIYQNGARINEVFGDTVQFDLMPEFAVRDVYLLPGSNPLFGLNALGGAVAIEMKNGFTFQGVGAEAGAGSFGRREAVLEIGQQYDGIGLYLAGKGFQEDGWRNFSESDLAQGYGDVAWRTDSADYGLSLTWADTDLNGNGASPIELLAVDREGVFTYPDNTKNQLIFLQGRSDISLGGAWSIQSAAFLRRLDRNTLNGDETDLDECADDDDFICDEEGGTVAGGDQVQDINGNNIEEDDVGDEPFGVFNRSFTDTTAFGGSVQGTLLNTFMDRDNQFIAGASVDLGRTTFFQSTELGSLTADRTVTSTGVFVGGDDFNTSIKSTSNAFGIYATDTVTLNPGFDLTLAARRAAATYARRRTRPAGRPDTVSRSHRRPRPRRPSRAPCSRHRPRPRPRSAPTRRPTPPRAASVPPPRCPLAPRAIRGSESPSPRPWATPGRPDASRSPRPRRRAPLRSPESACRNACLGPRGARRDSPARRRR